MKGLETNSDWQKRQYCKADLDENQKHCNLFLRHGVQVHQNVSPTINPSPIGWIKFPIRTQLSQTARLKFGHQLQEELDNKG